VELKELLGLQPLAVAVGKDRHGTWY